MCPFDPGDEIRILDLGAGSGIFLERLLARDAGFTKVDLFLKYHLWCVIGGQMPSS